MNTRNKTAGLQSDIYHVLLEACTNCRDQLLFLLAETGFRIGELLGVRYVEDIDYQRCRIHVEPRMDNENEVRDKYEEDRMHDTH